MFLSLLTFLACSDYSMVEQHDDAEMTVTEVTASTENVGTTTTTENEDDTAEVEVPSDACVPTGDEFCDGVDNNCDGNIDEGTALDAMTWYYDQDGDGYGSTDMVTACAPPLGYVNDTTDCNDTNANVNPAAEEVCDWIPDNNCDGIPDAGDSDGAFDANGDGDYEDDGDWQEHNGPDGYTWCFQYHDQVDEDHDGYCSSGMDLNGDGDCIDAGDIIYPSDQECPTEYDDCDVMDPNVYPGHGC